MTFIKIQPVNNPAIYVNVSHIIQFSSDGLKTTVFIAGLLLARFYLHRRERRGSSGSI